MEERGLGGREGGVDLGITHSGILYFVVVGIRVCDWCKYITVCCRIAYVIFFKFNLLCVEETYQYFLYHSGVCLY